MKTIAQQLNVKEFPFEIRDSHGNQIYCEDSDGFWCKIEYDSQGYEIYYEDSDGDITDNRPKSSNKYFYLVERQCGKTSKALYEFSKDPHNTVFITFNSNNADILCKRLGKKHPNIMTPDRFLNWIKGRKSPKTIIIDEYLSLSRKQEIYRNIKLLNPENLYIFSTPTPDHNHYVVNLIKTLKEHTTLSQFLSEQNPNVRKTIENDLNFWWDCFLTDHDVNVKYDLIELK
jgi:hypothetical protein